MLNLSCISRNSYFLYFYMFILNTNGSIIS
jgi:hypothetical protein